MSSSTLNSCSFPDGALLIPGTSGYYVMYGGWSLCILLAIISTTLTIRLVHKHFQHYTSPIVQRHIVRILMIVPVYSIVSVFQFRWFDLATVYELGSSIYEAFVVWSFFSLILVYVGDTEKEQREALSKMPDHNCLLPLGWVYRKKFSPRGKTFFLVSRIGVIQYIVVKPFASMLGIILAYYNLLCPHSFAIYHGQFWVSGLAMISVTIAMFILVTFYVVVHDEIQKNNPLQKLLAVKFVIFLSFWQKIVLGFLASSHYLPAYAPWTSDGLSASVQAFLLAIEMLIASIWHQWAFSWQEFLTNEGSIPTPVWKGFYDALLFRDVVFDVARIPQDVAQHRVYKLKKAAGRAVFDLDDNCITSDKNDDLEMMVTKSQAMSTQPRRNDPTLHTVTSARQVF